MSGSRGGKRSFRPKTANNASAGASTNAMNNQTASSAIAVAESGDAASGPSSTMDASSPAAIAAAAVAAALPRRARGGSSAKRGRGAPRGGADTGVGHGMARDELDQSSALHANQGPASAPLHSRQASISSSTGAHETCLICCFDIDYHVVTPCVHSNMICSKCATRLIVFPNKPAVRRGEEHKKQPKPARTCPFCKVSDCGRFANTVISEIVFAVYVGCECVCVCVCV